MHTENREKVASMVKKSKSVALRVAVIGVGNMGKHHVRNYSEIEIVDLVAISDLNETLGREMAEKYSCKYYRDHHEMLANEELDVVTIVVPSRYHHQVGLDVINSGVHVLMEKPIAMTDEEAVDLIQAAKKNNVKLMVGHVERFNPVVRELKKLIDSGRLGTIVSATARRVSSMPTQIRDANVLVDLAVHDVDIIAHLMGAYPNRIVANGGRAHLEDRDDHAEILLCFPGGATGIVEVNWVTPIRVRCMAVTGTAGYAEIDYLKQTLVLSEAVVTKTAEDFQDLLVKFGDPKTVSIPVPMGDDGKPKESIREEIISFLESILADTEPFTTGEDGRKALEMALAAEEDIKRSTI